MIILREEKNGGVLYDTKTLRFELLEFHSRPKCDVFLPMVSTLPTANRLSSPVRVYIELTRRCNLRCEHCFVSSHPNAPSGLESSLWKALLDELKQFRVIDVRFTGGEVTTRRDYLEILQHAKSLGFVVSLNTNGVYDKPSEVVNSIASLDLDQVTVSLDGLEASHDRMRGDGAFERSLNSLIEMRSKGVRTRVNCVISERNVEEVPQLLALAAPYVEEINFFYLRPVGRGRGLQSSMLGFQEHLESAIHTLSLQEAYPGIRIMHQEQAIRDRSYSSSTGSEEIRRLPSCETTMNVSHDGRYWPHGYNAYQDYKLSFGRFPVDRVAWAWSQSPRILAFREWQDRLIARCHRCSKYMNECPGSNIEMEIAKQLGHIPTNPYCTSEEPASYLVL